MILIDARDRPIREQPIAVVNGREHIRAQWVFALWAGGPGIFSPHCDSGDGIVRVWPTRGARSVRVRYGERA